MYRVISPDHKFYTAKAYASYKDAMVEKKKLEKQGYKAEIKRFNTF